MKNNLLFQALLKAISGFVLILLLLFTPAGSFNYLHGWLLIILLFIPMTLMGIVLYTKYPNILKLRLKTKEKEKTQINIILLSSIMFLASFIVAGMNYRYKWNSIPTVVVIIASILFLVGYYLFMEVLKQNEFLSRVVEIQENHKVVDTGLYGIVRHPMYLSTILMFLTMPLILNSLYSFIIMLIYPLILSKRIQNEEQVLEEGLKGYKEYKLKVKYKVIPYIW